MHSAGAEQPLEVAAKLVRRLQEAGVRYGVYKNIKSVPAGMAGRGDLDLIVASADMERFQAVLFELKAIRGYCHGSCGNAVQGREDWFVPDFAQGDYIHLDVSRGLIGGRKFSKRYAALQYEDVTEWRTAAAPLPPIPMVSPREEARIAVPKSQWRRLVDFRAYRLGRLGPGSAAGRRTIAPTGMTIALVGPDGCGKSSQAPVLTTLFQKKFRCATLYLGSGDGGWRLRRWATRRYHQGRPAQRDKDSAAPPRARPKAPGKAHATIAALAGLAAAIERYVGLRKARRIARSGAIVICDRWPQNLQPGLFDGPRHLPSRPSRIVRWLSSMERSLYRRMEKHEPDLAIHLLIDFETSRARKPGDRGPTDFEQRLSLMREMRARNPNITTVDARGTFAEVTRLLFQVFWVALWERSKSTPLQKYRYDMMAAGSETSAIGTLSAM